MYKIRSTILPITWMKWREIHREKIQKYERISKFGAFQEIPKENKVRISIFLDEPVQEIGMVNKLCLILKIIDMVVNLHARKPSNYLG